MDMREQEKRVTADEARQQLSPDLALLLDAMRSEWDSKLENTYNKLLSRLLMMSIPLGAVGGFAAELVRPGSAAQVAHTALGMLPLV